MAKKKPVRKARAAKRSASPARSSRAPKPKAKRKAPKAARRRAKPAKKPAAKNARGLKPAPKKALPPATRIVKVPKTEPEISLKKLVLVFIGPPGVGKGTQSVRLAQKLGLPHISTGDLFRDHMKRETALGIKAREFVNQGKLVPDEITVGLVEDRLAKGDTAFGYIFDGFPRTVGQEIELAKVLARRGEKLEAALYFAAPKETLVERISGRRTCRACGAISHARFNPTKVEGKCDKCGGETYQRADDSAEKVVKRLEEFEANTGPLVLRYQQQGLLREIDATQGVEEVFARLMDVVKGL